MFAGEAERFAQLDSALGDITLRPLDEAERVADRAGTVANPPIASQLLIRSFFYLDTT